MKLNIIIKKENLCKTSISSWNDDDIESIKSENIDYDKQKEHLLKSIFIFDLKILKIDKI